ncbi:MAG TPA: hypothetical protein VNE16_09475 [Vicinamibacterales bacterium]|nr:hypothetical protein [Vicinamibacterales bacterium]
MTTDMRKRTYIALAIILVAVLSLAGYDAVAYAHVISFVVRAANYQGWLRTAADWDTQPFTETRLEIPSRYGPLRAKLYRPESPRERAVLLVPGIHPAGIDEPRLVHLSRQLAATGIPVLTPELPDLVQFQITPQATDMIEDSALWLAAQRDLAPDGRIGMMGISFSGGLSVVAAGRPRLRDHVAYVFSFGGHGDLPRVLHYLCTGMEPAVPPDQRALDPHAGHYFQQHDYGVAVLTYMVADRLVPPDQLQAFRAGIHTFLLASGLDATDPAKAAVVFQQARTMAAQLPEPARDLLNLVNTRDVVHLGPKLLPFVDEYGGAPALSPDKSPAPSAPVYLLHGTDDNVIPSAESLLLADSLRGKTEVHVLISTLISHAQVDRAATALDVWRLLRFWKGMILR